MHITHIIYQPFSRVMPPNYMSTLLLSIWPLGYLVFHQNASKKIPSKHLQFEETTYKIKQIFGIQLQMITVQSHELLPLHITSTKNNQSVQKDGDTLTTHVHSFSTGKFEL